MDHALKKTIGMVLAGGRVDDLSILTQIRTKAALPFAGTCRIIDCALSNLMYSTINNIGILSQYRPSSLIAHIGTGEWWDYTGRLRNLKILPPYQGQSDYDWYRGTADAVYRNIDFIESYDPEYVLILSGDHIYRMDYDKLFAFHLEQDADLTIVFKKVPLETASQYGIGQIDPDGRVLQYEEKPQVPQSSYASLTIYLFKKAVLIKALQENAISGTTFQLYDEVIPSLVKGKRVFGYIFDGYWQYAKTMDQYFQANMDILSHQGNPPVIDLKKWNIRTNPELFQGSDPPPVRYGSQAEVKNSAIGCGCRIEGVVENSILSPFVVVEKGAVVRNSIVCVHSVIASGAVVDRAILDKSVHISSEVRIGPGEGDIPPNKLFPRSLTLKITLIGKETEIPAQMSIGTNCIIGPFLKAAQFKNKILRNGETLTNP